MRDLNKNPDLRMAGINTETGARSHWLDHGSGEGRQAHQGFHSIQYLDAYPDVRDACCDPDGECNYRAAIEHYIVWGWNENRLGAPFEVAPHLTVIKYTIEQQALSWHVRDALAALEASNAVEARETIAVLQQSKGGR